MPHRRYTFIVKLPVRHDFVTVNIALAARSDDCEAEGYLQPIFGEKVTFWPELDHLRKLLKRCPRVIGEITYDKTKIGERAHDLSNGMVPQVCAEVPQFLEVFGVATFRLVDHRLL